MMPPTQGAQESSAEGREARGRVSIVITTWNRAGLVGRAIDSALRQTYPDLEIIVVDDGSTDDTADVLARIAATARRPVRSLERANGGCASARNAGAALATGRWLHFLDSDDELEPTAIETLVGALVACDADFAYSPAIEVGPGGASRLNPPVAAGRPERFALEHFGNTNLRTGAYLIRTDLFRELGGFDESFSHNEDSDFVQRLALRGRAAYSDAPSVRCHTHAGGKSRNRVAIHSALLASSERILARHPQFASTLGARAEARLAELRGALAEALILDRRLDEARAFVSTKRARVSLAARLSLRLGSSLPLRIRSAASARLPGFLAARRAPTA